METKEILENIKKVLDSNITEEEKSAIRIVANQFVESIHCGNCDHELHEYTHGPMYLSCIFDENLIRFETRTFDQYFMKEKIIPKQCPIKKLKF
jgi:hypothetical protein